MKYGAALAQPIDVSLGRIKYDIEIAATRTMSRAKDGLKADLREQAIGAGLGQRVANTWRGQVYPQGGRVSINAAAFVWSKAPRIIDCFDRGPVIRTVNGKRYLAIPTPNVPRGPSRRKMTPHEVEIAFDQDLNFAKAANGRLVAYIMAYARGTGFRPPRRGELFRAFTRGTKTGFGGGRAVHVVMFVMVPTVKMPKKLSVDQIADTWAGNVPDMLGEELQRVQQT